MKGFLSLLMPRYRCHCRLLISEKHWSEMMMINDYNYDDDDSSDGFDDRLVIQDLNSNLLRESYDSPLATRSDNTSPMTRSDMRMMLDAFRTVGNASGGISTSGGIFFW
ncbi:hypothetical protein Tco_1180725, partial [Tanacetum coccineum]